MSHTRVPYESLHKSVPPERPIRVSGNVWPLVFDF